MVLPQVPCPTCGARPGRRCRNQWAVDRAPTQNVHKARRKAATAARTTPPCPMSECPAPRHDATGYQRYGCRCEAGLLAGTRYRKRRAVDLVTPGRSPKVPTVGARRRVQALARVGYSTVVIDAMIGCKGAVHAINTQQMMHRRTFDRLVAAYDTYSTVRPPVNRSSQYTATIAARKGWPIPECWTADTIDDPAAEPCCIDLGDGTINDVEILLERLRVGRLDSRTLTREDRKAVAERMVTEQSFTSTTRLLHMSGHRLLQIAEAS